MATDVRTAGQSSGLGATDRQDTWWAGPLATAIALGAFGIYATARAIFGYSTGTHAAGHGTDVLPHHSYLLSPFFSPLIVFPDMPAWLSPAFFILWAPGGFRLTCYYYRKAYYRAFFLDPPGCAVGEVKGNRYMGETGLLVVQNLHRYFMYLALIFLVILAIDVIHACIWPTEAGGSTFGVSVGSLVLLANTTLLTMYTFSCHSLRHLVGGNVDCYSCVAMGQARYKLWRGASVLNKNHMLWAWLSLFMVGFADFYVWMVASETITDLRFF